MLDDTLVIFTTRVRPYAVRAIRWQRGRPRPRSQQVRLLVLARRRRIEAGARLRSTDDIGWKAAEHPVTWHDFHATVLHLLGIDHEKLTFYHNGIRRR